jgi:hypothetical protein
MLKVVNVLLISAVIFACSQSKVEETTTVEPAAPAAEELVVDNTTETLADVPAEESAVEVEAETQEVEASSDNASAN